MSLPRSSFRGHFFKHLAFRATGVRFFSLHRGTNLNPFSFSSAPKPELQQQPQPQLPEKKITPAAYSSHSANSFTSTYDVSITSPYLAVRICCPRSAADRLSECLICFGASSATVDGLDSHDDSEEIWISSIFDVDVDVKDCILRAANSVGLEEMPNFEVKMLDHTDWIRKTQDSFHPVKIFEGLWIVPEWREPPEPEAAINIILNPGLAFGTGEHPTTKLCLLELHRLIKGGERFLDYGTGSGVLAIAALKFGAAVSVGFDIEPQAIAAVRSNATLNSIEPGELLATLVPSTHDHHFGNAACLYDAKLVSQKIIYDVVIANILLHPLLDLADQIVSYAKPNGIVCVSGIISEQVPKVVERYSPLLEDVNVSMIDDWACIRGRKKAE